MKDTLYKFWVLKVKLRDRSGGTGSTNNVGAVSALRGARTFDQVRIMLYLTRVATSSLFMRFPHCITLKLHIDLYEPTYVLPKHNVMQEMHA